MLWKLKNVTEVSYHVFLQSIVISFAGSNFLHACGELLRIELFNRKIEIGRITPLSSIFTEKVIDGISLGFNFKISILYSHNPLVCNWLKNLIVTIALVFFLVIMFILMFRYLNSPLSITWGKT